MTPFAEALDRIARAAELVGTPAYVYAPALAAARMSSLIETMRAADAAIEVAYAVKANPRHEFLARLAATGCDFDVASEGELDRVVAQGVAGARMVFSGPGKREREIERALAHGVRLNAEGERDLGLAAAWGQARGERVSVNLRVNPGGGQAENIIGGAGPSRFGVDEALLEDVAGRWADHPHVAVAGIQVFTASNVLGAEELGAHHTRAFALAERLFRNSPKLDTIDLGGGLGLPYEFGLRELDVKAVAKNVAGLLAGARAWGFAGRVLLEPGRWIAGPAGAYVARVLEIKHSQGVRFAVMDGGIHHLVRPALIRVDQPCVAWRAGTGRLPAGGATTFGGPLCTGLDILAHEVPCGDVQAGDLAIFLQAGAYGETEAMPDFLLHPYPRTAFVELS